MSNRFAQDIELMHETFGVNKAFDLMTNEQKSKFLAFRLNMLTEEFEETKLAYIHDEPEEIIDGLIDLMVIAIGTLQVFGVDTEKAWDEVYKANMAKEAGIKPERPNPLGLPDLIKPEGWVGPDHSDNLGALLDGLYEDN